MATAVATPSSALAVTTEILTLYRVVFKDTDDKGTEIQSFEIVNEKVGEETEKTHLFKGKEVLSIEAHSATKYSANTKEGAAELVSDDSEFVAMFNRGISTKQDNKFRQLLKSVEENGDFTMSVSETPYDLREDLKIPTNRRLSPAEKLTNELGSIALTPDMIALFEKLLAQRKAELGA